MPVIKSAQKKLAQDKKRTKQNKEIKDSLKDVLKKAKKNPTTPLLAQVFKLADKAAKKGVIHKNKASRIKSSLSKQLSKLSPKQTTPVKKSSPKKTKKSQS